MRRPVVAANWKLNGDSAMVNSLCAAINSHTDNAQNADVVICPPYPYLRESHTLLTATNAHLGAQNVALETKGAFTGEVAAEMLVEVGCRYVIVGHSERREYYGETDAIVAAKLIRAQQAGLIPIVCVGETLDQREQGAMQATITQQISVVLEQAGVNALDDAIIAYEPIWAIGTGKTASPEQAEEVHAMIRDIVAQQSNNVAETVRILYGGSVKADNAAELFAKQNIDGGLVGGASLDAEQFNTIITAAM